VDINIVVYGKLGKNINHKDTKNTKPVFNTPENPIEEDLLMNSF